MIYNMLSCFASVLRTRYFQQTDEYDDFPYGLEPDHFDDLSLEAWDPLNFVHQEVGLEHDAFSDVNSEYMRLPLPEGIDECVESPAYEPSIGLEDTLTPPIDTFSNSDVDNLRRIIGDACAATPTVLSVTMPWELPGISLVIGEEVDIVPTPILEPMPISDRELVTEMPSHRTARVEHIRGSYQEVIDFHLTLDDKEINECSWQRALEKWYIVFARGRDAWPRGYDIDDIVASKGVGGLRPIFGTRSHNTVVKRANSIIRYTHWFLKNRFSVNPFPISSADLEDYLEALQFEGASPSAANSLIEAIRFCDKVLNIQGLSDTVSPKALNLSELANSNRKEKRQARTLTVQEVRSLESFMADEKNVIVDRFACGCFLFALFSRSRWSDLRCVYGFASDIVEIEGKITGYLEYKTRSHKTARLVQRQGLSMPLVAPAWGVGSTPWAIEFAKVAKLANRPLDSLHNSPLLAAPTEDGEWTHRSTSTLEAKRWLLCVLKKALGKDPEATTIHCLKSTALSWSGKAGLGPEVRQVLGHHSTGKKSHEIYNRDLLAEPLRQLDSLFQRIRTGAFLPDMSRSGMVTDKTIADPAATYRLSPIQEEVHSSCSESSSTDSSSTEQNSQDDELPGLFNPLVTPEVWNPNFKMFKHVRTQVVHLLADGTTHNSFSCGVKLTSDYKQVDASKFLDFRKCKRCEVAKPLKDVGALASALKKQRLESARD